MQDTYNVLKMPQHRTSSVSNFSYDMKSTTYLLVPPPFTSTDYAHWPMVTQIKNLSSISKGDKPVPDPQCSEEDRKTLLSVTSLHQPF